MHLTYKKKLFLYFFLVFAVFTAIIVAVQRNREQVYKTENLRTNLNAYAEVIANYIRIHQLIPNHEIDSVKNVEPLLPSQLRFSIISENGDLLYDNRIEKEKVAESHKNRPEISSALIYGTGSHIRYSTTTGKKLYYFALHTDKLFIRVALPHDIELRNLLAGDNMFTYFILLLFFSALILLLYLSDRFGKAVSSLNDFIQSAGDDLPDYKKIHFPDTELGEIGNKIVANYQQLENSKNQLKLEKEKIIRHFHYSSEGICIFSADHRKIYANTYFVQYLNIIIDSPTFDVDHILDTPDFQELHTFLHNNTPVNPQANTLPIYQGKIHKNGKHFTVNLLIFNDNSYEVTLNNISATEKNRLLKQEMTNNISHELKTPVSSIRGYIETLLEQQEITPEKQQFFLERTYTQVLRLSDLIRDIALITKTEEAADRFEKETINICATINEVVADLDKSIKVNHINIQNHVGQEIEIEGNHTLLYSIFHNLIDNAINYAGEGISIQVENYAEDGEFYYFSFHDTGAGIDEAHLDKIFDRFYRIAEGRSRRTGGSGLGLSIVKNAILFHRGQISAKNRKEGGLEFIFSLCKKLA